MIATGFNPAENIIVEKIIPYRNDHCLHEDSSADLRSARGNQEIATPFRRIEIRRYHLSSRWD